tara:strand:- start:48 stop:287 length:240 start_codon:yes stop_codon:yes gene_type:complete
MSIIKDMLRHISNDEGDAIYLREITLLMEENDLLGETITKLKKELKTCKSRFIGYKKVSDECVVQVNKLKKELRELRKK